MLIALLPILLVALVSSWPVPAPAMHRSVTMPFRNDNNHVVLTARVNDADSLVFILDTGAAGSVMDSSTARRLGLAETGRHTMLGAGGAVEGSTVEGVILDLGGFQLHDLTFDTVPLGALSAQAGRHLDGILGHQVFERWIVEVDYQNRRVTLHDPDTYVYRGHGTSVPLAFRETHPYVTARITLAGRRPIQGRFVIDTGSSGGVIFNDAFAAEARVLETMSKTIDATGRGIGAPVENRVGRIERLEIQGLSMPGPIAIVRGANTGQVSAAGSLGNIGGAILGHFTVILDYPHRRMILEPNDRFGDPFEIDMSGMALVTTPPDFDAVRVVRVTPDSPAAELGVRVGDVIESLDGRSVTGESLGPLRESFRHEGRTFELAIQRGDERLHVRLRTRRMI
jgi:predicted aspartyl protease